MRLGIGSWTYPWSVGVPGYEKPARPMTAFGLLARAGELGVEVVQICDNIPLETWDSESLAKLRAEAARAGLALQTGTRGVEPGHLLRHLEIAKRLNAGFVRTLTDTPECRPDSASAACMLREAVKEFEKAHVQIAVENHDRFASRELAGIVESVGSPFAGVCLDTANCFAGLERPQDIVGVLAPYTINLHVKDFGIERIGNKMGFLITGRPAGQGNLDIDLILEALMKNGRSPLPDAILEQWPPFEGTAEKSVETECRWAEQGVRFLKEKPAGRAGRRRL